MAAALKQSKSSDNGEVSNCSEFQQLKMTTYMTHRRRETLPTRTHRATRPMPGVEIAAIYGTRREGQPIDFAASWREALL